MEKQRGRWLWMWAWTWVWALPLPLITLVILDSCLAALGLRLLLCYRDGEGSNLHEFWGGLKELVFVVLPQYYRAWHVGSSWCVSSVRHHVGSPDSATPPKSGLLPFFKSSCFSFRWLELLETEIIHGASVFQFLEQWLRLNCPIW